MPINPQLLLETNPAPTMDQLMAPELKRQQMQTALQDQQAQVQERLAQADALREANRQKRATYNASQAVRGVLANNPNATVDDLLKAGGPDALPVISNLITQKKSAIDAHTAELANHAKLIDEIGNVAYGLKQLPPEQRPKAHQAAVQRMLQAGMIDEEQANQMLAQHDTDEELDQIIATTPALKTQIADTQKQLNDAATRAREDAQRLEAEARTREIGKPKPGVDVPLSPDVEAQQVRMKQAEQKPPTKTFEEQTADDWLKKNPGKTLSDFAAWKANLNPSAGLITVQTVDADGKPVTKVVKKSEGAEFANSDAAKAQSKADQKAALGFEDIQKRYNTLVSLSKQHTSASDAAMVEKYFDIIKPSSGARMNQALINQLTSLGTAPARMRVWFKKASSRELFDESTRQEILAAAKTVLDANRPASGSGGATSSKPLVIPGGAVEQLLNRQ